VPLLLVRHARAESRAEWEDDDRLRPLDDRGRRQALELVETLDEFPIHAIYSSPYRRCVETVEPLARARGLPIVERRELGEELQTDQGVALVRSLSGEAVVVCGHGGLESCLVDPPKWRKGTTFVVSRELRVVATLAPTK
jgi:phosphohistidine phosphatase SixA